MRDTQRLLFLTMIWIIVTVAHQAIPSLAGTTITNFYKFIYSFTFLEAAYLAPAGSSHPHPPQEACPGYCLFDPK